MSHNVNDEGHNVNEGLALGTVIGLMGLTAATIGATLVFVLQLLTRMTEGLAQLQAVIDGAGRIP